MPATPTRKFARVLTELCRHNVDFIVVGGIAAVLEGAPINTFDLDVVHSRDAGNIVRLLAALESLDAHYRIQLELRLKPSASHLAGPGHSLLMTRFGSLDVLGSIGRAHDYNDLLPHTVEVGLADKSRVRVLDLETQIAIKEEVGGEKDLAVLPILRRTLEEKRRH